MSRLLAIAIAVVAASLAGATPGSGEAGKRTPMLRLAGTTPVTLRGTGFVPRERIRIIALSSGGKATKRVTASPSGRFQTRFPTIPFDRCNGFVALANGSAGSRAMLKLPLPLCPPSQ